MKTRVVSLAREEISYPILFAAGLLKSLPDLLSQEISEQKTLVITDQNVEPLYADQITQALREIGADWKLHSIKPGEASKTLETAQEIYTALIENNFDRSSFIIALGGGVVGDLAGFVAATFMRGIGLIQIPTTLLAQVDASVGGKTAVNHQLGKNLVGAFHQPVQVLIDPGTLKTLPKRELLSGLAEVVKTSLIADAELFQLLETQLDQIMEGNLLALSEIIPRCYEIKSAIVSQDERDSGIRAILNFGHTFGHALEAATDYRTFSHGEAVIWGMRVALELSLARGLLAAESAGRVLALLSKLPTPPLPEFDEDEIAQLLLRDKKADRGKLKFILLEDIGSPVIADQIKIAEILQALEQARGVLA